MKSSLFVVLGLWTSLSVAEARVVDALSDGSTVNCTAIYQIENQRYIAPLETLYRIDNGMKQAVAYVKKEQLQDYSFDGFCSHEVCELSIRDLRTNTISTTNGLFAPLNENTIYVRVSEYGSKPNAYATLSCSKIAAK